MYRNLEKIKGFLLVILLPVISEFNRVKKRILLLWCHKRLRFMVHFTRACKTLLSENNKTRLTFEKQQEKNKNIICRPWSVRIEKNCALGLEHGPRPAASGRTQDLWHSFSQYGPPGRQIIYIYPSFSNM